MRWVQPPQDQIYSQEGETRKKRVMLPRELRRLSDLLEHVGQKFNYPPAPNVTSAVRLRLEAEADLVIGSVANPEAATVYSPSELLDQVIEWFNAWLAEPGPSSFPFDKRQECIDRIETLPFYDRLLANLVEILNEMKLLEPYQASGNEDYLKWLFLSSILQETYIQRDEEHSITRNENGKRKQEEEEEEEETVPVAEARVLVNALEDRFTYIPDMRFHLLTIVHDSRVLGPAYLASVKLKDRVSSRLETLKHAASRVAEIFSFWLEVVSRFMNQNKSTEVSIRAVGTVLITLLKVAVIGYLGYRIISNPMRLLKPFLKQLNVPLPVGDEGE